MDWFTPLRRFWRRVYLCVKLISAWRTLGWLFDRWTDGL